MENPPREMWNTVCCKNSQVALSFVFFLRPSAVSLILC